jgi:hypothetical protein
MFAALEPTCMIPEISFAAIGAIEAMLIEVLLWLIVEELI